MKCNYRYCNKEIVWGRPDRKFCNKNCKSKEVSIIKELKSLNRKSEKSKDFVEKSKIKHNNKYNYDLVIYDNCRTKVKIICPVHGEFEQTPSAHLYAGSGCEKCARDTHKLNILAEERIDNLKRIHNNKYEYYDLNIQNSYINIYCKNHGTFSQYLYYHEYGHGCSLCNSTSRGENSIISYLDKKNILYKKEYTFEDCKRKKRLKFDFYLEKYNIIIEYDGEHHFSENKYFGINNLKYISTNDEIKNLYCTRNNIKLIRIPYWRYDDIESILESEIETISE